MNKFICTDIDSLQYGRKINQDIYEFKEFDRANYNFVDEIKLLGIKKFRKTYWRKKEFWVRNIINLQKYTSEQIKSFLSAYYPERNEISLTNWIIAECIFEQESGLY